MAPRTPLLRPDRYFAERDVQPQRLFVAILVFFAAGPVIVYGAGWVLTDRIDGTVMVENPNRPPDWYCSDEDPADLTSPDGCDAPKEIERDIDTVLWDAVDRMAGPVIAGFPLILALLTVLLHAGVKFVGGSRSVFHTAAIATWGMLPGLLVIPVGLVALWLTLDPVTVSPGDDPAATLGPLKGQLELLNPFSSLSSVLTAVWGGIIWRYGLLERQGLPGPKPRSWPGSSRS